MKYVKIFTYFIFHSAPEEGFSHIEELLDKTNKFISANFATVVNSEEFMNLSVQEVERWISSDGVISCEDDNFNIIVRWIDYDKQRRQEYAYN